MYENIVYKLHKELQRMDEKYMQEGKEFSGTDLDELEKVTRSLKNLACIEQESGMSRDAYPGYSARRGRDSMGRYTSRDEGPERHSYEYDRRGY